MPTFKPGLEDNHSKFNHDVNIAVVEDSDEEQIKFTDYMKRYMKSTNTKSRVNFYYSSAQFFEEENISTLDAIFLDIYIDTMTGIQIAKKISQIKPDCLIIFASVSKDFIHESYDLDALYYMVKPYTFETFEKVMVLIYESLNKLSTVINISVNRTQVSLNVNDIIYVDHYKHYLYFHLNDEVIKTYTMTFSDAQQAFLKYPCFINCYRCILANMKYISKIDGRDFVFVNGDRVPIKREHFVEIKDTYTRFIFNNTYKER